MQSKIYLWLLRISMGWLMFYAGITKILKDNWSAAGYLKGAKTFPEFFQSLLDPSVLPIVNFLNEWGLTLIGIALILGIGVRLAALGGVLLMLLYYFPALQFPYPNANSYIVDEHIIYALVFLLLAAADAGNVYGLKSWAVSKFPKMRWLLA